MSIVSSVTLIASILDGDPADSPNLPKINEWLANRGKGKLHDVTEHAGGRKAMQNRVWCGAFNMLDEDDFITFVRSLEWGDIENLAVVIEQEHGATRVFHGLGGELPDATWRGL